MQNYLCKQTLAPNVNKPLKFRHAKRVYLNPPNRKHVVSNVNVKVNFIYIYNVVKQSY